MEKKTADLEINNAFQEVTEDSSLEITGGDSLGEKLVGKLASILKDILKG